MNCPRCGAAMQLVENRGHFHCRYCGGFHFPEQQRGATACDVVDLGQASEVSCPVCARPLNHATLEGERVLYCGQCRGLLSSNGTFADVVRVRRRRFRDDQQPPRPLNPADLHRQIRCPQCNRIMDVHPYYGPGNAVIDTCGACAVVWLDHGELHVIDRAPGRV